MREAAGAKFVSIEETEAVSHVAHRIAEAIGRRDVETLAGLLAPGFLFRAPGQEGRTAREFLDSIAQIPGDILLVRLLTITVDLAGAGAVAMGVQQAQVRIDGSAVDEKRPFVDWFVKHEGEWRLRLAVELPALDS